MRGLETDATDKSHVVCKASADKHKWLRVRAMRLSAPCRYRHKLRSTLYAFATGQSCRQGPSRCLLVCAPDSVHIQTRAMPPFNTEYDLAQNGYTGGATFFDGIAPELMRQGERCNMALQVAHFQYHGRCSQRAKGIHRCRIEAGATAREGGMSEGER